MLNESQGLRFKPHLCLSLAFFLSNKQASEAWKNTGRTDNRKARQGVGFLEITCFWGRTTEPSLSFFYGTETESFQKGKEAGDGPDYVRCAGVCSALQGDTPVITHGWPPRLQEGHLHVRVPRWASAGPVQHTEASSYRPYPSFKDSWFRPQNRSRQIWEVHVLSATLEHLRQGDCKFKVSLGLQNILKGDLSHGVRLSL